MHAIPADRVCEFSDCIGWHTEYLLHFGTNAKEAYMGYGFAAEDTPFALQTLPCVLKLFVSDNRVDDLFVIQNSFQIIWKYNLDIIQNLENPI